MRIATAAGDIRWIIEEVWMQWNIWIRQAHRWLSIVFTLAVIANFIAMTWGPPPLWIVYAPLPPLFLMLASGLYLFALPYTAAGRRRRREARSHG